MIYYAIAAVFPLLSWALYEFWIKNEKNEINKKKAKKWFTVFAVLPMVLLFILRYKNVGSDTIGYVRFFQEEIRQYSFFELFNEDLIRLEIGFRVYVKLISYLTNNYTVFFLINAVVIFGSLLRFSLKYTKNTFIFFFLFITLGTYHFVETGLRQSLAIAICLWAIDFIESKKLFRFILTVALAYFFHNSAIIFLIMYPLCLIKKYDWIIFVYIIVTAITAVGFAAFQNVFNELFGYEYGVEETGNGGIFMMLVLILALFSFYMTYNAKGEEKTKTVIVHLSLLTVLFWVLRLISRTAERISYYYINGLYLYFSQAIDVNKDKLSALLKLLLILVCFALFIYRNGAAYYKFFWGGV